MKKFTVKDFIAYNNPCFSCGRQIKFQIGFMDLDSRSDQSYLRPTVTKDYVEIDLRITYMNSLKLWIDHKTNKMFTSSPTALTKYLENHKLFLASTCDHCMTHIESQFLEFNMAHGYVSAVGLARETLVVNEASKMYLITSSFIEEQSIITVNNLDRIKPMSPFTLELPLVPLYKLKTRERMLEKINTYLIFS